MPESRVRIGFPGGSQNNAVIRFQRDSDDDGDFDDIDILAFALNASDGTVSVDGTVIDGGTYGT